MPQPSASPQRIGSAVKSQRERRRMGVVQLAEAAGVSRRTVSRIERGERVRRTTLAKIAAALTISLDYFEMEDAS